MSAKGDRFAKRGRYRERSREWKLNGTRREQMKQFFDERMLGAREGKIEGGREGCEKGQAGRSEKANGWDFRGGAAISTYFHGSDFSGPGGGNGISGFHVPRQLH